MDDCSFTKLVVDSLEKAAAFYSSVFGLTESARVDAGIDGRVMVAFVRDAEGHFIEVVQRV